VRWWSGALNCDQAAIVDAIDRLCGEFVTQKHCEQWDRERTFPFEAMDALAANSWAALAVPVAYGGEGASAQDLSVVHQALARHSLAVAQAYYSLWVLGADAIHRLGTAEQRTTWLPRIAAGQARIAFALTEPGSGSDAAGLCTQARPDGDHYVVSGQKVFITGAAVADRIVTAVRTSRSDRRQAGITLLMIDPSLPGVTVRRLSKVGLRAIDLCEVFFDDVRVPAADVLGAVDDGWRQLSTGLAKERLYLAAISVGAMCDIVEKVQAHALQREAFGKPIGAHQLIGAKIVNIRVAADAAAGLLARAAELTEADTSDAVAAASVAKLFATEAYVSAARAGTQVFGGYGFTEDYPIARHYRDCKYLEIGGGTSEIQTIVIGRSMGLPL
jgi:alkylation response protein AidB-like acyl-CoA dehydrogenase